MSVQNKTKQAHMVGDMSGKGWGGEGGAWEDAEQEQEEGEEGCCTFSQLTETGTLEGQFN